MNYEQDLKAIDVRIKEDYERLVAERYLRVFSSIVRESADALKDRKIPSVELGFPSFRLSFLQNGDFMLDGEKVYPRRIEGDNLNGLLEIARTYREGYDYRHSMQTIMKMCFSDIRQSVRGTVVKKDRFNNIF